METRGAGVEPVFAGLAFVHTRQGHKNAFSPYIAGVSACSKNFDFCSLVKRVKCIDRAEAFLKMFRNRFLRRFI
jgi:hypothetical protein